MEDEYEDMSIDISKPHVWTKIALFLVITAIAAKGFSQVSC